MSAATAEVVVRTGRDVILIIPPDSDQMAFFTSEWGAVLLTEEVHAQLAARCRIPWRYYQRMLERAPRLLLQSVAEWWRQDPEDRLLRVGPHPAGLPGLWALDWNLPPAS